MGEAHLALVVGAAKLSLVMGVAQLALVGMKNCFYCPLNIYEISSGLKVITDKNSWAVH